MGKQHSPLERVTEVIRWTPSYGKVSIVQHDANSKKHGFPHLSIEAPNGDKLYNEMRSALSGSTLVNLQQRKRKPLHTIDLLAGIAYPIEGLVPFDVERSLQDNVKNVAQTRRSFVLQENFRQQYKYEERRVEHRNDDCERTKAESEINKCVVERKNNADKVAKLPLIAFFVQLLENGDPSVRVMAIRKFSHAIGTWTERELEQVQKEIDTCHSLVTDGNVSANKSDKELAANKQKYVDAKRKYQDSMLHIEHFWRELSHIYVANPNSSKNQRLPQLAAQHLLDGFSLELLDGDANLLNLNWIQAVFNALQRLIGGKQQACRMFVLSVMGVQSSGKSTLLNTMFGIKMRTSVGQCTRGINMQLLSVDGHPEYDYILVLDTEGTRSPDFHGMEGSEKRDNQMATLSILLADATVVVNPGENDAATKEILPIVLLAYQGSKLAEDNGGRLSSMMFFVYNRIDTTQKDKLANIVRTLSQSLQDAFKTVRELGGSSVAQQAPAPTHLPFTHFKLDTSNSSSSDVRILGQNTRSYEPPDNIPDPKYGKALVEFRKHIHQRVTQTRDGTPWNSRSPVQLAKYIGDVWQCICSADFTLRFAHVVERTTFDHLEADYQRCENNLASLYQAKFSELQKSMRKERTNIDVGNRAATTKLSERFQRQLGEAVMATVADLDGTVEQILSGKGREKWRVSYDQRWDLTKRKQSDNWARQLKCSFDMIFLYENEVAKLKSELRQCIRDKFSSVRTQQELANSSEGLLRSDYDRLIETFKQKAYKQSPPMNVKEAIGRIYKSNFTVKDHINVFNPSTEFECDKIFKEHRDGASGACNDGPNKNNWTFVPIREWNPFKSSASKSQHSKEDHDKAVLKSIHDKITTLLKRVERYDDGLVSTVIDETRTLLKESNRMRKGDAIQHGQRELAHVYARLALTHYMKDIQANWERNNSVYARFTDEKNMAEMHAYFKMVLTGAKMIKLFSCHLQNAFGDLSKAYLAEIVCLTAQRVKEQRWLYEIKWTQTYMDRYLLELIDSKKTKELIRYVVKPKELFTVVMQRLVGRIANQEFLTNGKGWREFKDRAKNAVKLATEKALSSKVKRASVFVDELRTRLIDALKSDALAKAIDLKLGDEYVALDNESDEDFRDACHKNLTSVIDSQSEFSNKENFLRQVSDLVIKQLRAENQPGAMPRCEAACPLCKSACIREAGHDTKLLKHDAHHQPRGLAGMEYRESRTLVEGVCSYCEDDRVFYKSRDSDEVDFVFGDWPNVHPEWEKPHPTTQEWPLREYIFYHYHKDIAKYYDRLPCSNMPESYNKDLATIRMKLEHGPMEF